MVVPNPAIKIFVPLLQPLKVKPVREKPVALSRLIAAPLAAVVAAGGVPAVEPFVL